jgi:hypothetical protein
VALGVLLLEIPMTGSTLVFDGFVNHMMLFMQGAMGGLAFCLPLPFRHAKILLLAQILMNPFMLPSYRLMISLMLLLQVMMQILVLRFQILMQRVMCSPVTYRSSSRYLAL